MVSIFDNCSANITVDGKSINLNLFDIAGQEDHLLIRSTNFYPQTDVFLVLFSVSNRDSFSNITQKWIHEIRQYCLDAPFLLVGTKIELREHVEKLQTFKINVKRELQFLKCNDGSSSPISYSPTCSSSSLSSHSNATASPSTKKKESHHQHYSNENEIKENYTIYHKSLVFHSHILLSIFEFLTPKELCTCSQVCKVWHQVADDDYIWKTCVIRRWNMMVTSCNVSWKSIYRAKYLEDLENKISSYLDNSLNRPNKGFVSWKEGMKLAKKIGASGYYEVSALTQKGVDILFEAAVRAVLEKGNEKKKRKWKIF